MSIQHEGDGRWVDKAWSPDQPGTFAVVVGVSRYVHLSGGPEPVAETYGLGQLAVSAITAFRFFTWLQTRYFYEGAPLARCWLLLSPSDAELAFDPALERACGPADFQSLSRALGEWFKTLEGQPAEAARRSRAFFFFSGHGLELSQEKQILLPANYLEPPNEAIDLALSTSNLTFAMRRLETPHQFFFVDACRSGHDRLRSAQISGTNVLSVFGTERNNPSVTAGLMYATDSGAQAWQQPSPDRGLSLFGQALLDGVTGQVPPDAEEDPPGVRYTDVHRYVNATVQKSLYEEGSLAQQPIRGTMVDLAVLHVRPDAIPPDRRVVRPSGRVPVDARTPKVWEPAKASEVDIDEVWYGHTRLIDLVSAEPVGGETRWLVDYASISSSRHVERVGTARHRITFALGGLSGPHALEITASDIRYCCLLPGVPDAQYQVLLESTDERGLVRCEVDMPYSTGGMLGRAALMWMRYNERDAAAAADFISDFDLDAANSSSRGKALPPQAPLVAAVAALVLLRAGQRDRLPDLGDLALRFIDLPDGPALWAAHLAQQGRGAPPGAAALDALLLLDTRLTLPFTSDAFGYAAALADVLGSTISEADLRAARLAALRRWLASAAPFNHVGGLFLVLAGPPEVVRWEMLVRPAVFA